MPWWAQHQDQKEETVFQQNEKTPLTDRTLEENMKAAPEYFNAQGVKVYGMIKKGHLSFRILAFLGGLGMVFVSLMDFIESLFGWAETTRFLIAFYTFVFGVVILFLEGKFFDFPQNWERTIKFYFRVVDYTWGRGVLYAFAGSFQFLKPVGWISAAVGIYMLIVGMVAIISSIGAGRKLAELRISIDSKRNLKLLFKEYDKNNDGALSDKEFALLLCETLGVEMTFQEVIACFNEIDKNDDDLIQYEEFKSWWTRWGATHLHRGISDIMV